MNIIYRRQKADTFLKCYSPFYRTHSSINVYQHLWTVWYMQSSPVGNAQGIKKVYYLGFFLEVVDFSREILKIQKV